MSLRLAVLAAFTLVTTAIAGCAAEPVSPEEDLGTSKNAESPAARIEDPALRVVHAPEARGEAALDRADESSLRLENVIAEGSSEKDSQGRPIVAPSHRVVTAPSPR